MSNDVQLVKAKLNIADIVRRYVDLKPVSGRWMGACPFHQETKPSMSVNEDEGFFYCFGCQASGDVIDFYKRINGLDFRDALEQLAQEAGVELTGRRAPDPQADAHKQHKKMCIEMHTQAAQYFRISLNNPTGSIIREYLQKRGLTQETIDTFGLGASPEDWHGLDNHLKSLGFTPDQGVESGLLSKNAKGNIYDRFRARLIFPIQNLSGQVIAFGGRVIIDEGPKYLNSSDSPIYKKGEHLYGLYQARKTMTVSRRALLTEGYMDVLSLYQFGYKDACGVLGTALTQEQVKRLAGFCSRVDLLFDGDGPGRKAALRSAEMILLAGVKCSVVLMPDGEDVDSILQTQGKEGFETLLDQARDGLAFATGMVCEEYAPKDIMAWATGFLAKLSDSSLMAYYLPRISQGLGVDEAQLRSAAGSRPGRSRSTASSGQQQGQPQRTGQQPTGRRQIEKEDKDDKLLLEFPIQYPEYIEDLESRGFSTVLGTSWGKALWGKIVQHQGQDILPYLAEGEKRLWTGCRMTREENLLTGERLLKEWQHICKLIEKFRKKANKEQLKSKIRAAQEAGDSALVEKYTKALSDALRRDDEQH